MSARANTFSSAPVAALTPTPFAKTSLSSAAMAPTALAVSSLKAVMAMSSPTSVAAHRAIPLTDWSSVLIGALS
ncbi:hypothetical protein [Shimia abyssi]|uniref:hypothetical protein n=1 Tax=Shimia abyssi TaxID=1662395 RepID=UPI0013FD5FDD|nr:hypothetical protein [Shimia abyssi]